MSMEFMKFKLAVVVGMAALLAGCSSVTYVDVNVLHAPEIGTGHYKRIYIADFKNLSLVPNLHDRISYGVTRALQSIGRLDVIDNAVYGSLLGPKDLHNDDLLVLTGVVTRGIADQEVVKGEPYKDKDSDRDTTKPGREKEMERHVDYTRTVNVKYEVQFTLTRAADAKVLAMPIIAGEVSDSKTLRDEAPKRFDLEEYSHRAETQIIDDFIHRVSPWREIVRVEFLTDDDMPELERGIDAARHQNWEGAEFSFQQAVTSHPTLKSEQLAKAHYDLGLAREFIYHFDEARASLKRAADLDRSASVYARAIGECSYREADHRRLHDQGWE